jgi:apoptosis-inducing factor 3
MVKVGGARLAVERICRTAEVSLGELREFRVGDTDVLVANVDGTFHCLAARCTHAGAPLVKGVLKGRELECPWHDASFNVTDGSVNYGPPKKPLQVYSCFEKGSELFALLPSTDLGG